MVLEVDYSDYQILVSHNDWILCCYLLIFVFSSNTSFAGQLESFSITEIGGEYEARIVVLFDAPAEYVYSVITDYKHIYRINPSIVETEVLPDRNDGVTRVRNRIEHCIAIFCIEVDMVEDVVEVGEGLLVAKTIPELSSFKSGSSMWYVRPFGNGQTRVQYRSSMKPNFFIPPFIGSMIVKSTLREEITISLSRIECYAKVMFEMDIENEQDLMDDVLDAILNEGKGCINTLGKSAHLSLETK